MQALSDGWNTTLFGGNARCLLQELDTTTFYSKMEAKPDTQIQMGFITYGMDYFDASNMLERLQVRAAGRPPRLEQRPVRQPAGDQGAAAFNTAKRQEIYTEAQTLMTREAPAVFLWHGLYGYLNWPYIKGRRWARTTSATPACSGRSSSHLLH